MGRMFLQKRPPQRSYRVVQVKDPVLPPVMARVRSLAWERLHAGGLAEEAGKTVEQQMKT